jgi:hypothetical protein
MKTKLKKSESSKINDTINLKISAKPHKPKLGVIEQLDKLENVYELAYVWGLADPWPRAGSVIYVQLAWPEGWLTKETLIDLQSQVKYYDEYMRANFGSAFLAVLNGGALVTCMSEFPLGVAECGSWLARWAAEQGCTSGCAMFGEGLGPEEEEFLRTGDIEILTSKPTH